MRVFASALIVLAAQAATAAHAADPVHDAIQGLFDGILEGFDFAGTPYGGADSRETVSKLQAMKNCELNSVMRTQGDAMALVHWDCPVGGSAKRVTAMLTFDQAKIVSVDFVSFVQVDTK